MNYVSVVDCNNFYASCERVFNPKLEGKPVVVLSNNDGCIIARSNEAKDLGVQMGAPAFKFKYIFEKYHVQIFSANFPLYADMSSRVMQTIFELAPEMEVYSIDEAFLTFDNISKDSILKYNRHIHSSVKKWIGLPVSIGIAQTKTLAKVANEIAKTHPRHGGVVAFFDDSETNHYLERVRVGDVWGIGRSLGPFLESHGIYTALQLKHCDDQWVKKNLSITGLRTVWELRGRPSTSFDQFHEPKKSIISSKSFGHLVESLADLKESVASYMARAAEKLRQEKEMASYVTVTITTNFHRQTDKQYYQHSTKHLPQPTSYTPQLIHYAHQVLEKIYKPGYRYKKAMVTLTGLVSENSFQQNLFFTSSTLPKQKKLMNSLDKLNHRWGRETIRFAAQGTIQPWKLRCALRSGRYTTSWNELPILLY